MTSANIPLPKLPSLPSELKTLAPFLQRAEELKNKDVVMAYWSLYYAAQLGLDLKCQQPAARDYLFDLITSLEALKNSLGDNEAIDNEAVASAYVENFGLKVFTMADNEDRKGDATRSTAKKFLAAANFLELLRVFEKSNVAQENEEKVRYAKWKAVDIAKAFREGRKPIAGPAGSGQDASIDALESTAAPVDGPSEPPPTASRRVSPPPPPITLPPSNLSMQAPAHLRTPQRAPHRSADMDDPQSALSSPGNWSTVATPGSDSVTPMGGATPMAPWNRRPQDTVPDMGSPLARRGNAHAPDNLASSPPKLGLPGSSDELSASKKVHFSSSVGSSSGSSGTPTAPAVPSPPSLPSAGPSAAIPISSERGDPPVVPLPASSPSGSSLAGSVHGSPPGRLIADPRSREGRRVSPPRSTDHARSGSLSSRQSPPGSHISPPPPPHPSIQPKTSPPVYPSNIQHPSFSSTSTAASSGRTSTTLLSSSPPGAYTVGSPKAAYPAYPQSAPSPPERPVELSSAQIAKAQKHCRFAISALEYEDSEQARKELRAALATLGE